MNLPVSMSLLLILWLSACHSVPTNIESLEEARSDYQAAVADPSVRELAGPEMRQADAAMMEADRAWYRNEDVAQVIQRAYVAKQSVALAQQQYRRKCAEMLIPGARTTPSPSQQMTLRACGRKPPQAPAP